MKRNAKPPSRHNIVMLETNAYNSLVENVMSNPQQNTTSSQHTHRKHIKKLANHDGSPSRYSKEIDSSPDHVTEPVYLVLIPDPPQRRESGGTVQNHTNKKSLDVGIKCDISFSATSPADGVGNSKLYVNVNPNQTDTVQHQNISSDQKPKRSIDKPNEQMSSDGSKVNGHAEQPAITKTAPPVLNGKTKSHVNESSQEVGGSDLKVTTTDLAGTDGGNKKNIVYENVSPKTGAKMPKLQDKQQMNGIDNNGIDNNGIDNNAYEEVEVA